MKSALNSLDIRRLSESENFGKVKMKQRLIGGSILFLMILFFIWLTWEKHLYEGSLISQTQAAQHRDDYLKWQTQDAYLNKEYHNRPFDFNSYGRDGYYKIDPETILTSLENGDTNVFKPLLKDPTKVERVADASISWTQADYLRVFSAFSKLVWDDSMGSQIWKIYYVDFVGSCFDKPCNLHNALIVYFKISANSYTTRIMEIQPSFGLVRWGDETSYPVVRQWKGVELSAARITAEDALKIAEKNGGREIRLRAPNKYTVTVHSWESDKNWQVQYIFDDPPFYQFLVDFDTGRYEFSEVYGLP